MTDFLEPKVLTVEGFLVNQKEALCKRIPRYQRAYSWDDEKVKGLLQDIYSAMSRAQKTYFIGSMLCIRRTGEDEVEYHEIVDGQQRLTTISLIFAVALHWINENNTPQLKKELGMSPARFIESLNSFLYYGGGLFDDDSALNDRPYVLRLGDNDHMSYQQIISDGQGTGNRRNGNLRNAYGAIKEFLIDKIKESGSAKCIREFIQFLAQKVYVVGIFISDEADPYEIFEVLNSRNMRLTAIDLIKNKLLSCFGNNKDDLDDAYLQWQVSMAACKESAKHMQEYVRCHMQMRSGEKIDPKLLYRELRDILGESHKKSEAKKFLVDLEGECHKFTALLSKDDQLWENFPKAIKSHVSYLKDYRVVLTLMFSMLYANKPSEYVHDAYRILTLFLKRTRAVRDRFSIMETYEQGFADLAHKIKNKRGPKNIKGFFGEIKTIDASGWVVIPDESFIQQMSDRPRVKESNAKEILIELSDYWQHKKKTATQIDPATVTLEHILPKKADYKNDWASFQNEEYAVSFRDRIGNLTLLEGRQNTAISNKKFSHKKTHAYADNVCAIRLTNELANENVWDPDAVKKRSKRLAKLAAEVWSFNDFD